MDPQGLEPMITHGILHYYRMLCGRRSANAPSQCL